MTRHLTRHLGDLAAAFVDEQLDARARARVLRHLRACGRCAADVEAQRLVKQRLRRLRPPAPPGALTARLLEVPNARPPGPAPPAGGADGEGVAEQGAAGLPVHVGTAGTPATARPARPVDRPPPRPSSPGGPPGKPGAETRGRRRRGVRTVVLGSASVLVLCMGLFGLAFALGGPSPEPGPQVVPEMPAYVAHHASVSNDRPLSDPALTTLTSRVLP